MGKRAGEITTDNRSADSRGRAKRRRLIWFVATFIVVVCAVCGCQSVSFYRQAIGGELQILTHQKPIKELLGDTNTSAALKHKFEVVLESREFARTNLHLPTDDSYLKYVDLHREYAVWNVNASPPLSLEPKRWWYPFVGRASYRGYFSRDAAVKYAQLLKKKGFDVYVGSVETYSTLGWFHDPVLNTFITEPDAELAEILFHELAHQRIFISGDTDFNEAFATAVGEEGVRRWLQGDTAAYAKYQKDREEEGQFVKLVLDGQDRLEAVYDDPHLSDAQKLAAKKAIIDNMRAKHTQMGLTNYDRWFAHEINNAKLNTVSAYYTLVPAFRALLEKNGGDLEKFYAAVQQLGKMPKQKRHTVLKQSLQKTVSGINDRADIDALHAAKINRTLAPETGRTSDLRLQNFGVSKNRPC
jgi:predicted aminopeptidase